MEGEKWICGATFDYLIMHKVGTALKSRLGCKGSTQECL